MRVWNVGIIGGGPGGLMTAYALQKLANRPVKITIFEASSRLGGKILTPQFKLAPMYYEAGAAEFYDYSQFDADPLKDLVAELGLPIGRMGGAAVLLQDRVLTNLDDLGDQLGPRECEAYRSFDQAARNSMTPQEFYHSDDPDGAPQPPDERPFDVFLNATVAPAARRYVESMIHSDLATEPSQTSVRYGLQNYLMNDPAYMQLYGIQGGNERLPQELAARIAATFRLEQRVVRVGRTSTKQLQVQSTQQGETRLDEFDFLVVALPHNVINSVSYTGERLAAAVSRHHDYYHYPAHYLRVTLLFRQPFWHGHLTDSYWMLDSFGGCCLYDESMRQPGCSQGVLGWLLSGAAASDLSHLSDEELIAEALDSLPSFLSHGREQLLEGYVHRWIGAVNAMPGGKVHKNLDQRHQPEPLEHPNLFFVGDYLFDSTLNGVLDSAHYVAAWIANLITEHTERQ